MSENFDLAAAIAAKRAELEPIWHKHLLPAYETHARFLVAEILAAEQRGYLRGRSEQRAADEKLRTEMIEALERVGCQFFACEGPTLEPEDMVTCFVCALLARLRGAGGEGPETP